MKSRCYFQSTVLCWKIIIIPEVVNMGSSGDPKKAIGLLQQTMNKALLGAEPHFITNCKHCLRMALICKPGEWDLDIIQGIGGNDVSIY